MLARATPLLLMLLLAGCASDAVEPLGQPPEPSRAEGHVWEMEIPAGNAWHAVLLTADPARKDPDWGTIFQYEFTSKERTPRALMLAVIEDGVLGPTTLHVGHLDGQHGMSFFDEGPRFLLFVASDNATEPTVLKFGFTKGFAGGLDGPAQRAPDRAGNGAFVAFYSESADGAQLAIETHGFEVDDTRFHPVALTALGFAGELRIGLNEQLGSASLYHCYGSVGVGLGAREGELRVSAVVGEESFEESTRWRSIGGGRSFGLQAVGPSIELEMAYAPTLEVGARTEFGCLGAPFAPTELGLRTPSRLFGVEDMLDPPSR